MTSGKVVMSAMEKKVGGEWEGSGKSDRVVTGEWGE